MGGSLKYGQASASLIVGKWSAASRQNTMAAALKEWGMLRRTIHTARYLSDPAYRRRITRQLNKGESLHALRRDLHYAQQGTITKPHLTEQTEQAWCLTVLTNALVTWTTEYYTLAVKQLRAGGRSVPGELLAHISPGHSDNINFFGVITKVDGDSFEMLTNPTADPQSAYGKKRLKVAVDAATLFDGSAMDDLRPGREMQMVGLDLRNGAVRATRLTVYEGKRPVRMGNGKVMPVTGPPK